MARFDAVFVGSGINSLVGAALLAKAGWRVCVLERSGWIGGNLLTRELTAPGFRHDVLSGWHPLFTGSPAYAELGGDLAARGLQYLNTEHPTAALFPDGSAAFLSTSAEGNREEFERLHPGDGEAWGGFTAEFSRQAELAFGLLGTELWSMTGLGLVGGWLRRLGREGSLEFGARLLSSARGWLEQAFRSEQVRGLLAPWVLHTGLGPDAAGSGFMLQVIGLALQMGGMPVPRGGGQRLADALASLIEDHGGRLETDTEVSQVLLRDGQAVGVRTAEGREVDAERAVLCSVTPTQLYLGLLSEQNGVAPSVVEKAGKFRYGRADMQIHLALSEPPHWPGGDPRFLETAMVHVCGGLDAVSRAVNEADRGLLPAEGTIVVGQPMAVDPARGPEGSWILWIQLQELPARPRGDAAGELDCGDGVWTEALREAYADRIVQRLAAQIPNLEPSILGRAVLSPADLERLNVNLVGGDPYSGACTLDQNLLWRPLPGLPHHHTPIGRLYHIGASTHPGPGLHGTSGYLAAKQLLRGEWLGPTWGR